MTLYYSLVFLLLIIEVWFFLTLHCFFCFFIYIKLTDFTCTQAGAFVVLIVSETIFKLKFLLFFLCFLLFSFEKVFTSLFYISYLFHTNGDAPFYAGCQSQN